MAMYRYVVIGVCLVGILFFAESCKDLGNEISAQRAVPLPPPQLSADQHLFNLVPQGIATTRLSGGTPPYSLVSRGDTTIVLSFLVGDSLKLQAVRVGHGTIVVGDAGSPRLTDTILVTVAQLAISQTSLNLIVGNSASTTISGGTLPYSFISVGDTTKVLPTISGSSLTVFARAAGTSVIIVGDNSVPRLSDTIEVRVILPLAVGQALFSLLVGDTSSTTISGGTAPYVVVSNSDPTKALATIVGATLRISALASGSTMVIVGDNSSPRQTDTIIVNVAVSFSQQIQPIFNAGCAVSGCHLPGGSGPMSLATGVSHGALVGIPATGGPCAGDQRVQPGNPNASALVKRLEGTCGTRMPIGGPQLSGAQIQLIRDWITQGAQNN